MLATLIRRGRLRAEDGFIIVEVLVSAVILVTVSLAVFLTLENADKAAGSQQKRALAANYAQSELERIRSLPIEDILAERGTKTVVVGNAPEQITYTESITAKWVSDGSDEPECTTRSGGLDYMRITTSLSWKGIGNAKPVTMTSLYTPPAGAGGGTTGSASVHITDRDGDPVPGIPVTLAGPSTYTETTNANGCVVFGFVPASTSYQVKFSRPNYVDGDSNNSVADPVTVTAGETTKLQYDYDSGGFTSAKFYTYAYGDTTTGQKTWPLRFQFFNAAQPSGPKTIPLDGTVGTWNSGNSAAWDGSMVPLFPFSSPYAVYAGNCKTNAVPSATGKATFVNLTPGQFQNAGTVLVPSLNVYVYSGSPAAPGSLVSGAYVQYDPGCTPIYQRITNSSGKLDDPAFPYTPTATPGTICAMSVGGSGRRIAQSQANTNFNGGTNVYLYLQGTGSKSGGYTSSQTSCFT